MFRPNRITVDEILLNVGKAMMIFCPRMFEIDFNGPFPQNAYCTYSYWAGYLEKPA